MRIQKITKKYHLSHLKIWFLQKQRKITIFLKNMPRMFSKFSQNLPSSFENFMKFHQKLFFNFFNNIPKIFSKISKEHLWNLTKRSLQYPQIFAKFIEISKFLQNFKQKILLNFPKVFKFLQNSGKISWR